MIFYRLVYIMQQVCGFNFENDFANGYVKPFATVDVQVNYKVLKNICEARIGATNLLTHIAAKPPIFIYFFGFLSFKKTETLAGKHFHL